MICFQRYFALEAHQRGGPVVTPHSYLVIEKFIGIKNGYALTGRA